MGKKFVIIHKNLIKSAFFRANVLTDKFKRIIKDIVVTKGAVPSYKLKFSRRNSNEQDRISSSYR